MMIAAAVMVMAVIVGTPLDNFVRNFSISESLPIPKQDFTNFYLPFLLIYFHQSLSELVDTLIDSGSSLKSTQPLGNL